MIKIQKSHISISSDENKDNSFNKNNINKGKKSLNNIEKYLNKLILISLKHKKFLERNDYFYSQLKKKNHIKKIKLKLTPFQKYEKFKMISKKMQTIALNKNIHTFNNQKLQNNNIEDLLITKNNNRLKKNKTQNNNKFCLTNYYPNYLYKNKLIRNKTKLYINSIDIDKNIKNLKIKKNKYSYLSYNNSNNNIKSNKENKTCQTFRNKTAFKNLNKAKENISLSKAAAKKRSIGILTNFIHPLKISNLKSRNQKIFPMNDVKNDTGKNEIPLVRMDESKFFNEIMATYK